MTSKRLKVLMASAELSPFSKVGGLADVIGSLPKVLAAAGVDIRLITPLYGSIDRKAHKIRRVAGVEPVYIQVGDREFSVSYFRSNFRKTKVQVFFIECNELFDREGIYDDPETTKAYPDNPTRFILFSKAIVEFMKTGVFSPDILHLSEYHTALVAPMLRTSQPDPALNRLPILLTIHNTKHQGRYDPHYVWEAGLDYRLAYPGGPFEFFGDFNFLKAGIIYSDKLNTVSQAFARETMLSPEKGFGLEGILSARQQDYVGILNGVDYSIWDPKVDKLIPKNYSRRSLSGKLANKQALLQRSGFRIKDSRYPLIGMVSRLDHQKGVDVLIESLPDILSHGLRMVVLGTGGYGNKLRGVQQEYSDRLSVNVTEDEELAHMIEAGSDMFLMPSRFEPCGLSQLYSLRYGTLPIVNKTGGLVDTIREYNPKSGDGWGFCFDGLTPVKLTEAVNEALYLFRDRETWQKLMRRAMALDFSWGKSAGRYKELYTELVHGRQ